MADEEEPVVTEETEEVGSYTYNYIIVTGGSSFEGWSGPPLHNLLRGEKNLGVSLGMLCIVVLCGQTPFCT